jgi:hypothetical protein
MFSFSERFNYAVSYALKSQDRLDFSLKPDSFRQWGQVIRKCGQVGRQPEAQAAPYDGHWLV